MSQKKRIFLDARSGGLGDVWMRLVGLYAAAALRPEMSIEACFAPSIRPLAKTAFSDRLRLVEEPESGSWIYTNRGLKDLLPELWAGRRYVAPLHRIVSSLKKQKIKARLNGLLFGLADRAGLISIAPPETLDRYCGCLETAAVPALRDIPPDALEAQIRSDFPKVRERLLNSPIYLRDAGGMPETSPRETPAVFPSGRSHQYMPVAWAERYLPKALFCFHSDDPDARLYEERGLAVARFATPEQLLVLARDRPRVFTTDSFPSHLLQYGCGALTILLTRTRAETVVAPGFDGRVFESAAPCCPCSYRERGAFPKCDAGHLSCLTWENEAWSARALA